MTNTLELTRPLVFLDLETTGLDVGTDRIVQFAAARIPADRGAPLYVNLRVNPGMPISMAATAVHGITDAQAAGWPLLEQHAAEIARFLADADWAGFGIKRFDLPILLRELARCGQTVVVPAVVDCLEIFHQREPRDLTAALRCYCDRAMEGAHDAAADVRAAMQVLGGQLQRYADLPRTVSALAGAFQDRDAVDLAGKLRRVGADVVVTFGKHRGTPLRALPADYLRWMVEKNVVDANAVETVPGHQSACFASERQEKRGLK